MTKEATMKRIATILAGFSVFLSILSGCGAGGGGGGTTNLQQKTATVVFSTVSSAHTAPLQGIQIDVMLPSGTSITDIASAVTGLNSSGRVIPGSYNPVTNIATFSVAQANFAPPSNFIKFGDFASLKCNITPGVTLDQSSFSLATSDIQMTGTDPGGTSINLVNQIPVKLSVTFGF